MPYDEFYLQSSPGVRLFGWQWLPDDQGACTGVVCIIHGIGEHSGRYAHLVNHLLRQGYAVAAIDQIGHGRSDGQRGHASRYEGLMENIERLIGKVKGDYPALPVFLLGHSWGGNQVLNFVLRRRPALRGVIALSPWLKLGFDPPVWKLLLGKGMKSVYPAFSQSSELAVHFISRDPEVVEAYRRDPLVHDRISASLFMDSHAAARWALDHAAEFPLPLLLIHGTDDKLVSPEGTREFAGRLKNNVTLKLLDGVYHETHNDLGKEAVFAAITDWLQAQVQPV